MSTLVFIAYVYFREEKVIKASSRELSFLQLVAIFLGYVTTLVYTAKPTHMNCATAYFLFCLTFNLIYAALLVKAVRIYRIFNSATKGNAQLKAVSPVSQILIASSIVLGQVRCYTYIVEYYYCNFFCEFNVYLKLICLSYLGSFKIVSKILLQSYNGIYKAILL